MPETPRMKWVDAEFVQKDDILLHDGNIMRIVNLESPYAVTRTYENGEFGERQVVELNGKYFVPSKPFLIESGVYESEFLQSEEAATFDARESTSRTRDAMFVLNMDEGFFDETEEEV